MAEAEPVVKVEVTTKESKYEGKSRLKQEPDTPGKIMVSGIPKQKEYKESDLEKEFAPYGRITEVNIIRDRRSALPRGFAFITYENPQDAEDAIKAMEGKDFGGEAPIHCEQAVIGLKKTKKLNSLDKLSTRGGPRGRISRGADRGGRGRGLGRDLVRGRGMDGRPMRSRGMRGFAAGGGGDRFREMYPEEEYYEEFGNNEGYEEYPPSRGGMQFRGGPGRGGPVRRMARGGPPGRGFPYGRGAPPPFGRGMPGRGGGAGEEYSQRGAGFRGGASRRALLPSPQARRGRGHVRGGEEYYGDEGNGYQNDEYYEGQGEEAYTEGGYEEQYSEEASYPNDYYTERPEPHPRGAAVPRGRGAPQQPRQVDEYGYGYNDLAMQQHRAARPPTAPVPRKPNIAPSYGEEGYEEEDPRVMQDPYGRSRGRVPATAAPAPRPGRGVAVNRGAAVSRGAVQARRGGLLRPDPYMGQDASAAYAEESYNEAYARRMPATTTVRQPAPNTRPRPPADDMYATERPQPKPQLMSIDPAAQRRGMAAAAAARYAEEYQGASNAREAYVEARRRRAEAEYRMREDPYREQRAAAETDMYVSYPTNARMPNEPAGRKRPVDPYEEGMEAARNAMLARREYEEYRSGQAAVPAKRERLDRNAYEAYSSRQEGVYRGL
ncbi:RNA-binding motif protein, X chromosome-like isoform X2 [Physella acuta]|uniref:RNA-binding motif protein, X chromosome-like isoform X2 n=1 Tax=Physella acuta TaxID=109671 RepID=UPI0027DB946A|nr:RNA-binding motif protein, X chromosome-like isoform X2 [Physella acuta]